MATPIHERLRAQTGAGHDAAEALLDDGEVLRSLDAYREFLRVQLSFVEHWEQSARLCLAEPHRTRWSAANRAALLRSDLSHLGGDAAPNPSVERGEGGEARAWGTAYVLEGSALGGRVLARRIADSLGLEREGLAFLRSGGAPERWRSFLVDLESAGSRLPADEIVEGARAGFGFFLKHLPRVAAAHRRAAG